MGVLLLAGAFWYRGNYNKKIQAARTENKIQLFTEQLDIKIPLAFEGQTITNQIKVRSFERTIKEPIDYDIAVELSKLEANKKLLANEKVWPVPINKTALGEKPQPPYTIKMVIYNDQLINSSFIVQAKKLVSSSTLFTVKSTSLNDIIEEPNTHELFFAGQIVIESEKEISLLDGARRSSASSTPSNIDTAPTSQQNIIDIIQTNATSSLSGATSTATTTPKYSTAITKYKLQKRSGPGSSYPSVGSINENITLIYIEEQNDYTKVQQENSLFWLKSEYLDFK